jgi:hypothetical protein
MPPNNPTRFAPDGNTSLGAAVGVVDLAPASTRPAATQGLFLNEELR